MTLPYTFLMAAAGNTSAPAAVDLDGTNDFLSRSSDFSGNTDGKVFTFSAFCYIDSNHGAENHFIYDSASDGGGGLSVHIEPSSGILRIFGKDSSGTNVLNAFTGDAIPYNTWINILISVDLVNPSNRAVYINDSLVSATWTTYTNTDIDFTQPLHQIGDRNDVTSGKVKGRLAHIFLDYVYRDLSIEANRRLFVTEDLKPTSDQESLSPIVYCPMTTPGNWFENPGTGGAFTPNGTVALSQRGPNQDNCVASKFNGVDNYLFKTLTLVDSKQLTLAFTFVPRDTIPDSNMFTLFSGGTYIIQIYANAAGNLTFELRDASQAIVTVQYPAGTIVIDKHYAVALTLDSTDVGKRSFKLNNVEADPSYWVAYNNLTIPYATYNIARVGRNQVSNYYEQDEGEVWFDTVYTTDLSVFWDSESNIPKPVRQIIAETGTTPIVALPVMADKAGTNLGTGGAFSASGIYAGARGMSEFWARSINTPNSTANYIRLDGNFGVTKTFSYFGAIFTTTGVEDFFIFEHPTLSYIPITIRCEDDGELNIKIYGETSGALIASIDNAGDQTTGVWKPVFVTIDAANSIASIWVDGANHIDATVANENISIDGLCSIGSKLTAVDTTSAIHYFTTSYIDFSVESERLKFVDALGYPIDLQKQIDNGEIPTPLIYMPFDDPDNLGNNAGTGGNFTINGTVTQGSDVDPN